VGSTEKDTTTLIDVTKFDTSDYKSARKNAPKSPRSTTGPIKAWETDPNFKYEVQRQPGGKDLLYCYQCSTCTLSCPIREINPDFNPRRIIEMAVLGMKEEILSSEEIWICASCQTCYERCPQNVKFSEVIGAIKNVAMKEAQEGNIEITSKKPGFDGSFMRMIEMFGRLYEPGLLMDFLLLKNKDFNGLFGYMPLGINMFKKGKIAFFPSKIKGMDCIKNIFEKLEEE